MQDKETGKLIPAGERRAVQTHYIIPDIEPYLSPVDDKYVGSRRAHRDDLKRTGCRVYEGRESEQRAAAEYRKEQDKKFDKTLTEGLHRTYYELRDGMVKPERKIKSSWLVGED